MSEADREILAQGILKREEREGWLGLFPGGHLNNLFGGGKKSEEKSKGNPSFTRDWERRELDSDFMGAEESEG